ncbi:MAG: hypothetical protein GY772_25310 [bacterium]|nr:hypothetical protein [bacterium]
MIERHMPPKQVLANTCSGHAAIEAQTGVPSEWPCVWVVEEAAVYRHDGMVAVRPDRAPRILHQAFDMRPPIALSDV